MSYDVDIISYELNLTDPSKSIENIRKGMYLDWDEDDTEDNKVKLMENCFPWTDEFINDLIKLVQIGVKGEIVIMSEVGEYIKFVLSDNEVKEYDGIIIYEVKPHEIHTELK